MTPDDDRRAVSTVLDVAVCLLFVTAAVGVLATADRPAPHRAETADRAVGLLGTTTATVHYPASGDAEASSAACAPDPDGPRPGDCRTAHGTVAALLARAAVADAADGGPSVAGSDRDAGSAFELAVRNATRQRLGVVAADWQVVVTWRAYPGAPLAGRVVVGPAPPPGRTVHAATLDVPVAGAERTGTDGRDRPPANIDAVARRAARTTINRLFPPEPTRLALAGGAPDGRRIAARYRRTAAVLGVDVSGAVEGGATGRADATLVDALAARYAADLRVRTDDPAEAAALVSVDTVTVTVRTWSA